MIYIYIYGGERERVERAAETNIWKEEVMMGLDKILSHTPLQKKKKKRRGPPQEGKQNHT